MNGDHFNRINLNKGRATVKKSTKAKVENSILNLLYKKKINKKKNKKIK